MFICFSDHGIKNLNSEEVRAGSVCVCPGAHSGTLRARPPIGERGRHPRAGSGGSAPGPGDNSGGEQPRDRTRRNKLKINTNYKMNGKKDTRGRGTARSVSTRSCAEKNPPRDEEEGREKRARAREGKGGLPHTRPGGKSPPPPPPGASPNFPPTSSPNSSGANSPRGPGGRLRPWQRGREGREREGDGEGGKRRPGRVLSARGGGQEGGPGAVGSAT